MNDMGAELSRAFADLWRSFIDRVPSVITGLVVFLLFWIGSRFVGMIIRRVGGRTGLPGNLVLLLIRVGSFLVMLLGALVAAVVIFPGFRPGDLVAGLGITSVAIGFAFKDIFQNFFAGIFLLWRQPFKVGDEIRSGDFEGTVEEITARSTRIRTYDGERAVIPNGDVYTQAVLVRTAFEKRRVRFVVGIGYPDSIEKARATIFGVLQRTEGVLDDPGPWVYVTELAPSSVNLTVYFWVNSSQSNQLKVSDAVATGVKLALDEAGIDMPFPHEVVLLHDQTGTREGDREEAPAKSG